MDKDEKGALSPMTNRFSGKRNPSRLNPLGQELHSATRAGSWPSVLASQAQQPVDSRHRRAVSCDGTMVDVGNRGTISCAGNAVGEPLESETVAVEGRPRLRGDGQSSGIPHV